MAFKSSPTSSLRDVGAIPASKNNTDVVHQKFSLFIEGVEVPWEAISITQQYRALPTADIQVPPVSGLLDILRGYEPKVFVFYEDLNYGGDRLLFWGTIKSGSYSLDREAGAASINFHCAHKNSVMEQIVLDFGGWVNPVNGSMTDPNAAGGSKVSSMNSLSMVVEALKGVSGVAAAGQDLVLDIAQDKAAEAPTDKVPEFLAKFEQRLLGIPGVTLNIWNQVKRSCLSDPLGSMALYKMYIPMLEQGIAYFQRMSGHYVLETRLHSAKTPYCHGDTPSENKILTPPCFSNPLISASQSTLAVQSIANAIGFSGELTPLIEVFNLVFQTCEYEVQTLASPAEINISPQDFSEGPDSEGREKVAIETVVKPQMPFYYSPTCNVLLPRMYRSINVGQEEGGLPSRVVALHDAHPTDGGGLSTSFKGPASVRQAVAFNASLKNPTIGSDGRTRMTLSIQDTLSTNWTLPGRYEWGRGVKTEKIALPWWLSVMSSEQAGHSKSNQETAPEKGTQEYDMLMALAKEWYDRNGKYAVEDQNGAMVVVYRGGGNSLDPSLNYLDPNNQDVQAYQRLMFSAMDSEFTKRMLGSRTGMVSALFNPYIIPGYPMEVVNDSPNQPSFHALCTSVTHTLTSRSLETTIGMACVQTYAELSNYYMPPVPPALQAALNMVDYEVDVTKRDTTAAGNLEPYSKTNGTILQNQRSKATADAFYRSVLGVGAAAPDDLIHFASGRAYPVRRQAGILLSETIPDSAHQPANHHEHSKTGRENEDFYSSVGNLRLVARPIETQASISAKFGYTFIPKNPDIYNQAQARYVNPLAASSTFLEPGASMFLDYPVQSNPN